MQHGLPIKARRRTFGFGMSPIWLTERQQLGLILSVTLLQALLFIVIVPPWQHYDEPTHFEYAWLVAQLGRRPVPGDEDVSMRREVQASMAARGFFSARPSLLETDARSIDIGYSELGHPPGYYALAALPIRLFPHLDVASQLYLARMVSLGLFVATIAIAWGSIRELTPSGDALRWAVPLFIALLPTFADVMTSVNSDVGAVFALSLLIWGAVRVIKRGLQWLDLLWLFGSVALCVVMKNTAMYGLILVPLAVLLALFVRLNWKAGRFVALLYILPLIGLLALFGWGDAARWYRSSAGNAQSTATRVAAGKSVLGNYSFTISADPSGPERQLIFPIDDSVVSELAGSPVTLGAWVWANQSAQLTALDLQLATAGRAEFERPALPINVSTTPAFVAQTFLLPSDISRGRVVLSAHLSGPVQPPLLVYFDAVTLVAGTPDTASVPQYNDPSAADGAWGGRPFHNLVGNASAEQAWPMPRAWIDDRISTLARMRPSEVVLSLIDWQRIGYLIGGWSVPLAIDGVMQRFAWSQVRLESPIWVWVWRSWVVVALLGWVVSWLLRYRRLIPAPQQAIAVFLALTCIAVWTVTILRPLPALSAALSAPVPRYAFPAIVPTAYVLVGGWLMLWHRKRDAGASLVVVAALILNIAAVVTLHSYFT